MFDLKKAMLILLLLESHYTFSVTTSSEGTRGNLINSPQRNTWDFSAQGLYLQTTAGSLNSGGHQSIGDFNQYINVGNNWGWGFQIEGSYHLQADRDITLNWYHIDHNNKSVLGPLIDDGGSLMNGPLVYASHDPSWDAINLALGRTINLNQQYMTHIFAGLGYVSLAEKLAFSSPGPGNEVLYRDHAITYNGFGPRLGASSSYNIGSNLAVYAEGALAVYSGTAREATLGFNADSPPLGSYLHSMFIVPELEVKLGANYIHSFAKSNLSLDTGWMWINYFQALITRVTGTVHAENFGFQGPYIGLKWSA